MDREQVRHARWEGRELAQSIDLRPCVAVQSRMRVVMIAVRHGDCRAVSVSSTFVVFRREMVRLGVRERFSGGRESAYTGEQQSEDA